jgi:cytochrome c-type biogenesis protein CcmH
MFWALAILLAAVVVFVLVRPLLSSAPEAAGGPHAGDLAVYRDQLAELEADAARGTLGADDAAGARIEISRRMLAADALSPALPVRSAVRKPAVVAAALGVPLLAFGLYLQNGFPGMPDQPRSARTGIGVEKAEVGDLVARVEKRLADKPDDGAGWDVIGPVYMKQERYPEAVNAFARVLLLLGETPSRLYGLAEAHIKAGDGVVNDVAREAYARILKLKPDAVEPRFWLAMAQEQDGKTKEAAAAYRALIDSAPPDAPWRGFVLERLVALSGAAPGTPSPPREKGPTADAMKAAGQMTPEARAEMIAGMVAGLETRLAADGRDAGGWQRLIRAYVVLGNNEKAALALRNARKALAAQPADLAAVNEMAKDAGLAP